MLNTYLMDLVQTGRVWLMTHDQSPLIKSCSAVGSSYETEYEIWSGLGRWGNLEFIYFL